MRRRNIFDLTTNLFDESDVAGIVEVVGAVDIVGMKLLGGISEEEVEVGLDGEVLLVTGFFFAVVVVDVVVVAVEGGFFLFLRFSWLSEFSAAFCNF